MNLCKNCRHFYENYSHGEFFGWHDTGCYAPHAAKMDYVWGGIAAAPIEDVRGEDSECRYFSQKPLGWCRRAFIAIARIKSTQPVVEGK